MSIRGRCVIPHVVMVTGRDICEGDSVVIHVPERASGLVLTVRATCANVVGKVTIGRDVPPPPIILVGKEFRPAAMVCQRVPDRSHNKIISDCVVSFLACGGRVSDLQGIERLITPLRDGVLPAIPPAARSPQSLDTSTMHIGFRCVVSLSAERS
jgi:hypothetical protein